MRWVILDGSHLLGMLVLQARCRVYHSVLAPSECVRTLVCECPTHLTSQISVPLCLSVCMYVSVCLCVCSAVLEGSLLECQANLVIAPSHLTKQWQEEIQDNCPVLRVIVITTKWQHEKVGNILHSVV